MVRVLIQPSSKPELRIQALTTALFDAASKGHTEVVELIIATGAFTEARNGEGFTPLQASAFDGNQTLRSSYFYTGPMLKQYITSKGLHFT